MNDFCLFFPILCAIAIAIGLLVGRVILKRQERKQIEQDAILQEEIFETLHLRNVKIYFEDKEITGDTKNIRFTPLLVPDRKAIQKAFDVSIMQAYNRGYRKGYQKIQARKIARSQSRN